jgi:hypothetical protein
MDCPVIAVIGTELMTYTTEGRWGGPASPADLFMAPQKRTVFLNLHKQRDTGDIAPFLYADEAYAKRQCGNSMNCLGTFPIEIED